MSAKSLGSLQTLHDASLLIALEGPGSALSLGSSRHFAGTTETVTRFPRTATYCGSNQMPQAEGPNLSISEVVFSHAVYLTEGVFEGPRNSEPVPELLPGGAGRVPARVFAPLQGFRKLKVGKLWCAADGGFASFTISFTRVLQG